MLSESAAEAGSDYYSIQRIIVINSRYLHPAILLRTRPVNSLCITTPQLNSSPALSQFWRRWDHLKGARLAGYLRADSRI